MAIEEASDKASRLQAGFRKQSFSLLPMSGAISRTSAVTTNSTSTTSQQRDERHEHHEHHHPARPLAPLRPLSSAE
jgi:hypothetical protein